MCEQMENILLWGNLDSNSELKASLNSEQSVEALNVATWVEEGHW